MISGIVSRLVCVDSLLLEQFKAALAEGKILDIDIRVSMEALSEVFASMSMRIKDESLFKPPAQQPFRNDVIRARVENKTNNVPFN